MENNYETKYKPLGMRIIAALTAFIAGLSIIGDPSFAVMAEAADKCIADVIADNDEDIPVTDLDAEELIIDDFPEVKANYIPLSEEEQAEAVKALVVSSMKGIKLRADEDFTGFITGDLNETANNSLKIFSYRYVFTAPEPYEGDTSNYIERSDNFFVKGVITINTEHVLPAGHMEFRVPMYLLQERNGGYCQINGVAVEKYSRIPEKDENGVYMVDGLYTESKAPFNYYIDTASNEYVFINYQELNSAASIIEISYDKVDVFDIANNTDWSISPKANIVYDIERTGALFVNGEMVGEGTDNSYFTECEYNGEKLYMRGSESDETGCTLSTYCNAQGLPVFVHKYKKEPVIDQWYVISGKPLAAAEDLIYGLTPSTDEAPHITVCCESIPIEKYVSEPLSGKINTSVELTSVTKSPEPNNSRGYGAQLYTLGQMKKYISVDALDSRVLSGNKLSDDYIYTCWRVYTKGVCTQPWSMLFEENPMAAKFDSEHNVITYANGDTVFEPVDGAIVLGVSTMLQNSYSKRTDTKVSSNSSDIQRLYNYVDRSKLAGHGDYWYVADTNTEMRGTFGLQSVAKEHTFNIGYYAVVAYPKDKLTSYDDEYGATHYPPFKNEVTAYLYSRDSEDFVRGENVSNDNIVYNKFEWKGGNSYWHTYKRVEGECKDGLISVYDKLVENANGNTDGEYIGDIMFHESYRGGAYAECHDNTNFSHINGKYYKVVNTDDVITAQPYGEIKDNDGVLKRVYGKPQVLDGSDYFFSKGILTLSEFEVDPYEDEEYALDQEAAAQVIDSGDPSLTRDWVVYGWYEGEDDWKEIDLTKFGYPHKHFTVEDYVELRGKNSLLKLTLDFLGKGEKCPYRLKVEHNCIAYNTRLNWDIETQLKLGSTKFQAGGSLRTGFYYENGTAVSDPDFDMFRICLTNYSATKATVYNGNAVEKELLNIFNSTRDQYENVEGLLEKTLVNANRYLFVDMGKIYSDSTLHCKKDDLTKTALGSALLPSGGLESPYGDSEFLPLKYINGTQTFTTLDEFTDANKHIYRDHAEIDISILETDAKAEKFASWENDTKNGQVVMTYTLSGFEGYKISKELRPLIEEMNIKASPERNKIILYDLLPLGVSYYGFEVPDAGKLTTTRIGSEDSASITFDDVENYYASWDRSKVKLEGVEVTENWEGSGREMVAFTVRFTDSAAVLTDSNWFVGCGLRFKAYVSWDNYGPAREKDNIFAYTVHQSDTNNDGNIYGRYTETDESQVFDGAGTVVPSSVISSVDYTPFKNKTLENTRSDKHNRIYGHANDMESVTMARTLGIKKQVRADIDKYADYESQTSVVKENNYTYKIHIDKTAQGAAGGIVIFDKIEAMSDGHGGGHGTFTGIDLSEIAINFPEIVPDIKVWYSESLDAPTVLYKNSNGDYTLNFADERTEWNFDEANKLVPDEKNWKLLTDDVVKSTVKSIAIDFGDTVLAEQATLNAYIKMKAPLDISEAKFALNEASYYFTDYEKNPSGVYVTKDTFEYSNSEITIVSFGEKRELDIIKNIIGKVPTSLDNEKKFTFKVVSRLNYYKGGVDDKDFDFSNIGYNLKKADESEFDGIVHATNSDGEFVLGAGETANFSSVASVEFSDTSNYDFDNYNITEKNPPYWFGVQSISQAENDSSHKILTFNNSFRPVIYLTKKTKGVPEGDEPDLTFKYKVRLYDKGSDTPLDFSEGSGYKLLSKTEDNDDRADNRLYWYKVSGSAGWYETPQGWNTENDRTGLLNDTGAAIKSDEKGAYFEINFNSKKTSTIAVPIYIQHIVDGTDVGMLNDDGTPRYRVSIEEIEDPHWYCTAPEKSGELGAGENLYIWINNYMFKELLIKKIVTHAPDDLSDKPFTFRLTDKSGAPYYTNEKGTVKWTLCTMDEKGEITELTSSGTVDNNGTFTVMGCGNNAESSGDVYVIKLSYLALEDKGKDAEYTVTEVLDENADFRATKGSNTVKIKGTGLNFTVDIENDYLKRDITIKKIVAASSMPAENKKFTMVLCPDGLAAKPAEYITGTLLKKDGSTVTLTANPTSIPKNGWSFEIGEGCSVTFDDIGKAGEKFELYEMFDASYLPLTLEIGDNGYTRPQTIELPPDDDYSTEVVNGSDGYIVLRKQFTGDITDISSELDNEEIELSLSLRKNNGDYLDDLGVSGAIIGVSIPVTNINSIKLKRNETVIINMNELRSLAGSDFDGSFRIREKSYSKAVQKDDSWYIVEPSNEDAVWEFGSDAKQGIIVNKVTKFDGDNAIYKRIGLKNDNITRPTGVISFTIRDNDNKPVKGVSCIVSKFNASGSDETMTDYKCVSDENGIINIDISDENIQNIGWRNSNKNMLYFLKLYFDRGVKINPSSSEVLSITENTIAADKSWGSPVGYEQFGDTSTYVNKELLEGGSLSQWTIKDADTFVNSQDTEKIAFSKEVDPSGEELTDDDKNTLFRFTVSELIGSSYQPTPHVSYKVYNESGELVREGVTDLDEEDPNTGWGVFTLHHGEKAELDLPKNAYWQVSEDNTGKYKLVADEDGNITSGSDEKALFADSASETGHDAKYIAQGFEFHTTFDMLSSYPMGYDVVLINGRANANYPMFAKYDESQDSYDLAEDNVTEISRTARLKTGQTNANNFYYVGAYNYNANKYNGSYALSDDVSRIYSGNDESEMWSYSSGTTSVYKANILSLPDTIIIEDSDGKRTEHKIVGIGKEAYANVGLTRVKIPKYVKKIGDNAFNHNFGLINVDMSECIDLKVIGVAAFADGSMSVELPDTVETVEDIAFAGYHTTNGTRNGLNNRFTIPSALCYLQHKASSINNQRFGSSGHYTSNVTLRIGGGDSIPDMMTNFKTITDGRYQAIYTLGLGDIPFVPYNVIIGQNPNGLRIKEAARFHWDRNGGTNNTNMIYGRIIVFPKGKLSLEARSLRQNGQIASLNFLRVFLTEDPADLNIEGDMDTYHVHQQYIVFPNFTRAEAFSYSNWTTKENYLKSANSSGNVHIYYRDDLNATTIEDIISTIGTDIVDDDVKSLLYTSVGLTPPTPLPAPRHLTAPEKVISHNDIYLEKKKELLD